MSGFRITTKPDTLEDGEYWCWDDEGNSLLVHDVYSSSSAADLARKQWEESPDDDFPISVEDSRGHVWIYTRNTVRHSKSVSVNTQRQSIYSLALIAREAYLEGYRSGFEDGVNLSEDDPDLDKFWENSRSAKKLLGILDRLDKEELPDEPVLIIKEVR